MTIFVFVLGVAVMFLFRREDPNLKRLKRMQKTREKVYTKRRVRKALRADPPELDIITGYIRRKMGAGSR